MNRPTILNCNLLILIALLGAAGCSRHKPDAVVLQGSWKGQEAQPNAAGSDHLVLTGKNLSFVGANTNEWYQGTFTLLEDKSPKQLIAVITECPDPQYVGKTALAIYKMEDGVFTLAAREPGDPNPPTSFDDPNIRRIVFTKQ